MNFFVLAQFFAACCSSFAKPTGQKQGKQKAGLRQLHIQQHSSIFFS
ncbi:hypothetical protein [Bacillus sp. OTU530]